MKPPEKREPHRRNLRRGFSLAKEAAIDRCKCEMRQGDEQGNEAIARCIAAIQALSSRSY